MSLQGCSKKNFEKSWQLGKILKDWQTAKTLLFSRRIKKKKAADIVYFDFYKTFNTPIIVPIISA